MIFDSNNVLYYLADLDARPYQRVVNPGGGHYYLGTNGS